MARTREEVEEIAMELDEADRLALAERLVSSVPFDPVIQRAWVEESFRRDGLLRSGEDPGLTLEQFWSDDEP